MTNLEFYKRKIPALSLCYAAYICKHGENCIHKDCLGCELHGDIDKCVETLLAKHKEPIKLKQWEYDLLNELSKDWNYAERKVFWKLHKKGYFKDVPYTGMEPKEILENCEVIDDD